MGPRSSGDVRAELQPRIGKWFKKPHCPFVQVADGATASAAPGKVEEKSRTLLASRRQTHHPQ